MASSRGRLILTALGIAFLVFRIAFPPHYGLSIIKRSQGGAEFKLRDVAEADQAGSSRFDQQPLGQKHHADTTDPEFRILIGIMSPFWASWRRQIVRNAYKRFPKSLPIDIVFIEGNIAVDNKNIDRIRAMQRTVIDWENSTYGDIMHLDWDEYMNYGKTYEFLKKVGLEYGGKYTHVLKTDDDSFVNIPALVEVIREHQHEKHLYWGTSYRDISEVTWGRIGTGNRTELWGSGYLLSWDIVEWLATSYTPSTDLYAFNEDWQVFSWLMDCGLDDNYVVNRTAFSEYPYPELADTEYLLWNEVRPFDRWVIVTHPLKYDWMFVETAEYYLGLEW